MLTFRCRLQLLIADHIGSSSLGLGHKLCVFFRRNLLRGQLFIEVGNAFGQLAFGFWFVCFCAPSSSPSGSCSTGSATGFWLLVSAACPALAVVSRRRVQAAVLQAARPRPLLLKASQRLIVNLLVGLR